MKSPVSRWAPVLFALLVVGLHFPLLDAANTNKIIFGVPVLHAYVFGLWGGSILVAALRSYRSRRP